MLVIFDCDGVLVDSESLSIGVLVETMHHLGLDLTADDCYRLFLGRSFASLKSTLASSFGVAITDDQVAAMRERLYAVYRRQLKPIPGIVDVLSQMAEPYCVASSSQPDRIRLSLDITGLSAFFGDRVFSASMVAHGKPAPDLFLHAAAEMTAKPSGCVVIEDSPAGIEAAKRAGMRCMAFLGGSHAAPAGLRAAVASLEPDRVFERMDELPQLIAHLEEH